jgi:hypothetical protein
LPFIGFRSCFLAVPALSTYGPGLPHIVVLRQSPGELKTRVNWGALQHGDAFEVMPAQVFAAAHGQGGVDLAAVRKAYSDSKRQVSVW